MQIHLQVITYNESRSIKQFLEYYSWCASVTVYDNKSTDTTREIIREVRPDANIIEFDTKNVIDNRKFCEIKNTGWLGVKADWIIVVDCDEYLHSPYKEQSIVQYLDLMKNRSITVIPTVGFNVHFDEFSPDFLSKIKDLSFAPMYGKCAIFNPNKISEINYDVGAHEISPKGTVRFTQPHLFLLHCRYFGFQDWEIRNDEYAARVNHHIPGASFYMDQKNRIKNVDDFKAEFEANRMDISNLLNLKGRRKK